MQRKILYYQTASGVIPFWQWLNSLDDVITKARILKRLDYAAMGNLGKHRAVGEGVIELKLDFGPGYRLYTGLRGSELLVMLNGGDKHSQQTDIRKAHLYWADYWKRS